MAYVITRHKSTNGKYRLSIFYPMTMIGEYTDLAAAKGAADEHWTHIIREFLED